MNWMSAFENNGNFWADGMSYEDVEAINFLHDQFVSLDGYRDSAERLNNWDSVWFMRANRCLQRYLENEYFYAGPEDTYYGDYAGAVEFLHGLFSEISDYTPILMMPPAAWWKMWRITTIPSIRPPIPMMPTAY